MSFSTTPSALLHSDVSLVYYNLRNRCDNWVVFIRAPNVYKSKYSLVVSVHFMPNEQDPGTRYSSCLQQQWQSPWTKIMWLYPQNYIIEMFYHVIRLELGIMGNVLHIQQMPGIDEVLTCTRKYTDQHLCVLPTWMYFNMHCSSNWN